MSLRFRRSLRIAPGLVPSIKAGVQQVEQWGILEKQAAAMDFDAVVKSLEALSPFYAEAVGAFSDEEFRGELALFGPNAGRCRAAGGWSIMCCASMRRTALSCSAT